MTKTNRVNALPEGYSLHWYEIIRVIGRGGFGITYLARDNNLHLDVAIKEYLPEDFASRIDEKTVSPKAEQESLYKWGLERFLTEARTLARFIHPNIVRVLSVFEKNGTAYMVMEYAHGEDLSTIYKTRAPLNEEKYLDIYIPIMDGLALVHNAGFIHRDIKPANIYICENETPILLDFGSARQSLGSKTKALTSLVTFGYAPFEQYNEGSGKQGPWTDIFSLGASMYVGITGEKPVDVFKRGTSLLDKGIDPYKPLSVVAAGRFTDNFLLAIDNALMFKAADRPQNVWSWADILLGKTAAQALPDYMLKEEVNDEAETVIIDKDHSAPPTTGPSRGAQGLIDASGKRAAGREQTYNKSQRVQTPASSGFDTFVGARLYAYLRNLIRQPWHSLFRIAVAASIVAAVISIGVYVWQRPPDMISSEPTGVGQEDVAVEGPKAQIDDVLERAREKQQQGQIFEPANDNAFYYYSQIIKFDADNEEARKALSDLHRELIDKTRDLIEQKQHTAAGQSLAFAEKVFPGHEQHAKLKDLLRQAQEIEMQIGQLLVQGDKALSQKQFTKPPENNAYYYFKRVTELEPDNSLALKGIKQIENALLALAASSIKFKKPEQAMAYLDQVESFNLDSERAKMLRKQIKLPVSQPSHLSELLSLAETQYKKRRYTTPKDDNAFDTYQKILAIDPDNQQSKTGLANIKKFYKRRFDRHIRRSELSKAKKDLEIMERIAEGEWVTRRMQRILAEKEREALTPTKPDIELISKLMAEFKTNLEKRNMVRIKKISVFVPGRQQFVEQLLEQYQHLKVTISDFRYIAINHEANANVELSDLVDKNGRSVTPGAWSKFSIRLAKDAHQEFKVYW